MVHEGMDRPRTIQEIKVLESFHPFVFLTLFLVALFPVLLLLHTSMDSMLRKFDPIGAIDLAERLGTTSCYSPLITRNNLPTPEPWPTNPSFSWDAIFLTCTSTWYAA